MDKEFVDYGERVFPDGEKYLGSIKNGKMHGHGQLIIPTGESFVGQFRNDKYDGHGIFTFSDGSL